MTLNSPIKYYGGKSYMRSFILKHFPFKMDYDLYCEGFGGGASILLAKEEDPLEVYNDLGENVYSLFKVLSDKEKFEKLKEKMDLTPYSAQVRQEFKESLKNDNLTIDERAYKFLVVNRSSFNGVGGFSTTLLVRRGMSKSVSDYLSMIDGLPQIHNRLSSVIVENRDILDFIKKYDSERTFFYLDPPYIRETRLSNQNYEKEMSNEDHEALIDAVLNAKGLFLISGYNHPIYDKLLSKFERIDFESPNAGSNAIESLWKNY